MLKVRLYATLRDMAGTKLLEVPFEYGQTARDLVKAIQQASPELGRQIADPDGNLTGVAHLYVHGRNILWLDDLDTVITDAHEVDLFPPVAGGTWPLRFEFDLRNLPRDRIMGYLAEAGGVQDGHLAVVGQGWQARLEEMPPAKVGRFSVPRDLLIIEGSDADAVQRVCAFMRHKTMRGGG
jgi:molybdopterin synthase sulfur carrier subunit